MEKKHPPKAIKERKPIKDRKKKWPQIRDLITWWIFYNLDQVPSEEVTPAKIDEWYMDVMRYRKNHNQIHRKLYQEFEEFRAVFTDPG